MGMTNIYLLLAMPLTMGHHPWDLIWIGAEVVWLPIMIRSYIKGDTELEAQRKRELSQQRIIELEKELGIEPPDFSDLPDEAIHEPKKEL
jgi:hypothetical protein